MTFWNGGIPWMKRQMGFSILHVTVVVVEFVIEAVTVEFAIEAVMLEFVIEAVMSAC